MISTKRSLLKTISYRILATIVTILIAFFMGVSFEYSTLIGLTELIIKPFIYFLHEEIWRKIK
jgi:uncharacterized membrane protein